MENTQFIENIFLNDELSTKTKNSHVSLLYNGVSCQFFKKKKYFAVEYLFVLLSVCLFFSLNPLDLVALGPLPKRKAKGKN